MDQKFTFILLLYLGFFIESGICDCTPTAPTDGTLGDCSGTIAQSSTCQPNCNVGFKISGQTTCDASDILTDATCSPCSQGTFSGAVDSSTSCANCVAGSIVEIGSGNGVVSSGGTNCTACGSGTYSASSNVACANCAAGSIVEIGSGNGVVSSFATHCTECSVGKFSSNSGIVPCTDCPNGQGAVAGSNSCISCDAKCVECISPSNCILSTIHDTVIHLINPKSATWSKVYVNATMPNTSLPCVELCQNNNTVEIKFSEEFVLDKTDVHVALLPPISFTHNIIGNLSIINETFPTLLFMISPNISDFSLLQFEIENIMNPRSTGLKNGAEISIYNGNTSGIIARQSNITVTPEIEQTVYTSKIVLESIAANSSTDMTYHFLLASRLLENDIISLTLPNYRIDTVITIHDYMCSNLQRQDILWEATAKIQEQNVVVVNFTLGNGLIPPETSCYITTSGWTNPAVPEFANTSLRTVMVRTSRSYDNIGPIKIASTPQISAVQRFSRDDGGVVLFEELNIFSLHANVSCFTIDETDPICSQNAQSCSNGQRYNGSSTTIQIFRNHSVKSRGCIMNIENSIYTVLITNVTCAAGTYSDTGYSINNDDCRVCPNGTYLQDPGTMPIYHDSESDCIKCELGKSLMDVQHLSTLHDNPADCKICSGGTYAEVDGSASCIHCPMGTYLSDEATEAQRHTSKCQCLGCEPGYFGNNSGTQACSECHRGYFEDKLGSTACKACNRWEQSTLAAVTCTPIPADVGELIGYPTGPQMAEGDSFSYFIGIDREPTLPVTVKIESLSEFCTLTPSSSEVV